MTAIFLAGGEVETLTRALLDNGCKRVLYSFFYIHQMKRQGFIERMQREYPEVEWFLDSGAFTYWAKFEKEPDRLMPVTEYKDLYYAYIRATWPNWSRITELDFDDMFEDIDLDVITEWRNEMLTEWPEAPIMPVWHWSRGSEEWTSYVRDRRIRYLAIGSGVALLDSYAAPARGMGEQPVLKSRTGGYRGVEAERIHRGVPSERAKTLKPMEGVLRKMVHEAHIHNKLVHGFGMTRVNTALKQIPYDTVDSTSWLMSQKFGTIFIFKNNTFKLLGKDGPLGKKARRNYRSYFTNIGCDWRLIEEDNVAECRKANVIAWTRLSDRLEMVRSRQKKTLLHEDRSAILNPNLPRDRPLPRSTSGVHGRDANGKTSGSSVGEVLGKGEQEGSKEVSHEDPVLGVDERSQQRGVRAGKGRVE